MEFEATYLVAVLTPAIHPHVEARRTPKCQRSCVLIAGRTASSSAFAEPHQGCRHHMALPTRHTRSRRSYLLPARPELVSPHQGRSSTIIFLMIEFLRVLSDFV